MCLGAPSIPSPLPAPPPPPRPPEPVMVNKPTTVEPARSRRASMRQASQGTSSLTIPISTGGTTQTGLNIGK